MALPSELSAALRTASTALSQDPDGRLSLPHRRRIRQLFGPFLQNDEEQPEGPGYRRRARLSILCVQYVLPVWDAAHLDANDLNTNDTENISPQQMLEVAEGVLAGQVSQQQARQANRRFSSVVEGILMNTPAAAYVGYASIDAVGVAFHDDDSGASPEEEDDDLTPDEWDDSYRADLAASGGEPGEDNSSNQRRREFWQWYLEQAVPQAYESVPE